MTNVALSLVAFATLLGCASSHAPPRACATSTDCTDDEPCTFDERCDAESRTCTSGVLDADGDGLAPLACGGTDCNDGRGGDHCGDPGVVVDAGEFCLVYEASVCARDNARMPDETVAAMCRRTITGRCDGFQWPEGCAPTPAVAEACLDALVDPRRIGAPPEAIPECLALCPVS